MGVDLNKHHVKRAERKVPKSQDPYLRLLVRLYRFLARRTQSAFNKVILKRLCMTRINRPPVSTSRLAKFMKGKKDNKVAVVVGTVTDDPRLLDVPKLTVTALRFTRTARARITKVGGQCLTFDQLALKRPTGANTILIRGPKNARTTTKYFGAPGVPNSTTRPRQIAYGRRKERARGRRASRGFKV